MAADLVVEYWTELMGRTPFTPEVMAQWKRVLDHGLEAWSRALSEVMATEDFARLLGTSIEQWLAMQASLTGKAAPLPAQTGLLTGQADVLMALATEMRRLEERLRRLEERMARAAESSDEPSVPASRRRTRGRRAA